jgi:hypothetical protein
MKWLKWSLVSILVVAAVVVFSTKVFPKKYTYYYYPEWNAYYDVAHKNYIYSIDGGKTWDTITNSSNEVANTLGKKVTLHSSSAEIWLNNAEHRQHYGGTLNDLVGGFLKTGEDKRTITKKNLVKDSSKINLDKTDSTIHDSNAIEEWVHETTNEENAAKENKPKEIESKPSSEQTENTVIPAGDSIGI